MRARKMRLLAACAAALAWSSCAPSATGLPGRPQFVKVHMDEYRFAHHPERLRPGRVVFRLRNLGKLPHQLSLSPLPADFPPLQQQLRGSVRRPVPLQALVPSVDPGKTGTFAADLVAGRYAMICYLNDPGGTAHWAKGMGSEFRVS